MKNAVRCCISCILPCGALDVVRIVHTNGHVEGISRTIKASEILKLHPKHVLKKPSSPSSSSSSSDDDRPKIVAVDPESELKRGKIYFLMPLPPQKKLHVHDKKGAKPSSRASSAAATKRKKKNQSHEKNVGIMNSCVDNLVVCDQYLSEIMTENKVSRERRRGRVGVWRPHLESISEML